MGVITLPRKKGGRGGAVWETKDSVSCALCAAKCARLSAMSMEHKPEGRGVVVVWEFKRFDGVNDEHSCVMAGGD